MTHPSETHTRLGTLVTTGFITVGDPCYFINSPEGNFLTGDLAVPAGTLTCYASHTKSNTWGKRVASMTVLWDGTPETTTLGEVVPVVGQQGYLGVDSGQMAIFSGEAVMEYALAPEGSWAENGRMYLHKASGRMLKEHRDFQHFESPIPGENNQTMNQLNATGEWEQVPPIIGDDLNYMNICNTTLYTPDFAGVIRRNAFVASSGYGDGSYPCHFRTQEDRWVGYTIQFIGQED